MTDKEATMHICEPYAGTSSLNTLKMSLDGVMSLMCGRRVTFILPSSRPGSSFEMRHLDLLEMPAAASVDFRPSIHPKESFLSVDWGHERVRITNCGTLYPVAVTTSDGLCFLVCTSDMTTQTLVLASQHTSVRATGLHLIADLAPNSQDRPWGDRSRRNTALCGGPARIHFAWTKGQPKYYDGCDVTCDFITVASSDAVLKVWGGLSHGVAPVVVSEIDLSSLVGDATMTFTDMEIKGVLSCRVNKSTVIIIVALSGGGLACAAAHFEPTSAYISLPRATFTPESVKTTFMPLMSLSHSLALLPLHDAVHTLEHVAIDGRAGEPLEQQKEQKQQGQQEHRQGVSIVLIANCGLIHIMFPSPTVRGEASIAVAQIVKAINPVVSFTPLGGAVISGTWACNDGFLTCSMLGHTTRWEWQQTRSDDAATAVTTTASKSNNSSRSCSGTCHPVAIDYLTLPPDMWMTGVCTDSLGVFDMHAVVVRSQEHDEWALRRREHLTNIQEAYLCVVVQAHDRSKGLLQDMTSALTTLIDSISAPSWSQGGSNYMLLLFLSTLHHEDVWRKRARQQPELYGPYTARDYVVVDLGRTSTCVAPVFSSSLPSPALPTVAHQRECVGPPMQGRAQSFLRHFVSAIVPCLTENGATGLTNKADFRSAPLNIRGDKTALEPHLQLLRLFMWMPNSDSDHCRLVHIYILQFIMGILGAFAVTHAVFISDPAVGGLPGAPEGHGYTWLDGSGRGYDYMDMMQLSILAKWSAMACDNLLQQHPSLLKKDEAKALSRMLEVLEAAENQASRTHGPQYAEMIREVRARYPGGLPSARDSVVSFEGRRRSCPMCEAEMLLHNVLRAMCPVCSIAFRWDFLSGRLIAPDVDAVGGNDDEAMTEVGNLKCSMCDYTSLSASEEICACVWIPDLLKIPRCDVCCSYMVPT